MTEVNTNLDNNNIPQEEARTHEEEIITFHDQGHQAIDKALPMIQDLPVSYLNASIASDQEHTIVRFLQRPIKVYSGKFSSTNTVQQQLWTAVFPDALISNTMYAEKLSGFVGLRADLEIKVQVNAHKFQQGRLRLQYIPYAQYMDAGRILSMNSSLQGITSCPGVDVDICGGSTPESRVAEATLHIPYVSPHLYYNLIEGYGTFGTCSLYVYSPLLTGGTANDCEITIWARFIEPKVAFPTAATMKQPARMKAQVRGEAKQIQKTGVISNTLGVVADTLSMAKKIPVIGEYVAIPEWIAKKGEAIAKLFGFSKPSVAIDTKLRTSNCFANYNGKDSTHKMALSADNEIDTPSGIAGTQLDEMALTSITGIPTYWDTFNWPNTAIADQVLWALPVTPALIKAQAGSSTNYLTTPMGMVSETFCQWRGSLVYTFKIVKTGFHAGRLRVFFVPYADPSTIPTGGVPTIEIEKNYQCVVDIAESDEVSFTVPFVATKPWLIHSTLHGYTGYIVVSVLNELRAPDACAQNVNVIVEINGGHDLTFSVPREPDFVPFIPTTTRMKAQVAGTSTAPKRNESQMLVDPMSIAQQDVHENWSPESHCVGEKIASLRQLLKRNNFLGTIYLRQPDPTTLPNAQEVGVVAPFNFGASQGNTEMQQYDYLSYYAVLYAFYRGAMRIKVQTQVRNTTLNYWHNSSSLWFKYFAGPTTIYETILGFVYKVANCLGKTTINQVNNANMVLIPPAYACSASTVLSNTDVEGIHEVEIPYYNSSHISVVRMSTGTSQVLQTTTDLQLDDLVNPNGFVIFGEPSLLSPNEVTSCNVYRSAGDDFGFHYLVGVPLFQQSTATAADYTLPTTN
jgi:hypothetical protein